MNRNEYLHRSAELHFLQKQLSKTGLSKLSAMSIRSRIEETQAYLEEHGENAYQPAKVTLTYRGAPVWGTHGVLAEFGTAATQAFSEAIATIAASLSGALADKGPIPNRSNNQLLITGTALGSFGFELEEVPAQKQLEIEGTTSVSQAIDLMTELLEATTKSDEELSEPVSRLADRAIASVSDFLGKLSSFEASCSVTTRTRKFQFVDTEQVRRSKDRLSVDNIKETVETFDGEFIGALPDKRAFEFRTSDGVVIYGGIPRDIPNPNAVNQHLYQNFKITLSAKRIGSSRPRYILHSFPWSE
ncbi:hypothetical protein HX870_03415 [Pseudomonas gingeri]|uniref:hypothetical protein n=1 Tax=Pseudomonas gingeri TaxID=117681 RepID=UPI0015A3F01D|nr:hypothetical protein [Pseudomonas gingeri]NWA24205.1 hypothetical protein [Pseudomonas gingeri]NWD66668.1 hypothetical protein [Pseudomonas gingeri]